MILASQKGNLKQVQDAYGDTALTMASQEGHIEIVRLEQKAKVDLSNETGLTALNLASWKGLFCAF